MSSYFLRLVALDELLPELLSSDVALPDSIVLGAPLFEPLADG